MPPRSLIVVSADRLYADAAASYLDGRDGWTVASVLTDGLHALDAVRRLEPSAVLIIGEPDRIASGPLSDQLRRRANTLHVVIVGGSSDGAPVSLQPDSTADAVLAELGNTAGSARGHERPRRDAGLARLAGLTTRERRVLSLVASGVSAREVAERLKVSEHTVRTHMQNLYAKLGVHSRVQLIRFADRYGLSARASDGVRERQH